MLILNPENNKGDWEAVHEYACMVMEDYAGFEPHPLIFLHDIANPTPILIERYADPSYKPV